jgi:catecholate siderophore receptor
MQQRPALRPLATDISHPELSASAGVRRPGLLPLGAMMAAVALSGVAQAQESAPAEAAALPAINVKTQREENTGYQGVKTTVGKTPQLLRDVPQSVTVVTEQLIQDRGADTLKEALRNVAGLTFNAGEGGRIGDNVTLRGYSLVGDLYLDGMRDIAQYNREVFNIEQVDVLRGSASMLFGRGSTGGVVNQVSKRPFLSNINEAAVTVGSYAYKRGTADLNRVVGENAAVRLNVMETDTDSFRDGVHSERWGVAPSFSWGIGTKDEFNLSYYKLKSDSTPDFGVPYFQGKPLDVPVNRFYGLPDVDYQREDTDMTTASWIHRFDKDTSLRTVLLKANYDRDLWAVAPRLTGNPSVITDATPINRQAQRRGGVEHTLTSQTDFLTSLHLGGMKHEVLAGVELVREEADRWNYNAAPANPATTVGNINPYPVLPAGYGDKTHINPTSYTGNTAGFYAQDMVSLTREWKVLVGARRDTLRADYQRAATASEISAGDARDRFFSRNDNVWSYRTGLIYQPSDTASYYASYGTSFNPSAELYALDTPGANTDPEKNRNIEIGAKWDLLDGNLMFRTALFRSEKTNERNTDLANTSLTENLLSGKRHTDGIEFELAGRITPRWEIFGGLALMRARIDAATLDQRNQVGSRPINTPPYTANLWATYRLTEGWRIGGGVEAAGFRNANLPNAAGTSTLNVVPKYYRLDGMVEYQAEKYSVKMNVFNLLNKDYYEGVYAGHTVPGTQRAVQLTLSTKF